MRIGATKFREARRKAVTLMDLYGVGKTMLANRLPATRWFIYSGDYRIGIQDLREPILDNIKSPKPSRRSSRAGPSRGSSRTAGRYTPSWPPSTAIRFPRAPRSRCEAKRISWIWWPARSNRLAA